MRMSGLAATTALGVCLAGTSHVYADSVTGPVSNIGLIGSHNQYKLTVDGESDKDRVNQGGLYYNFGNKLTGQEGVVYQIGAEGQYGKEGDTKFKAAKAEFDVGLRAPLSINNYLDFIVGGGYDWGRVQQDDVRIGFTEEDVKLTTKQPFAKAGVGYNYLTPGYTVRLELGARYSIEGRSKLKVGDESESVDLKDKVNPYGELSFLWNKGINNLPVSAGLYYTQTRYQLDSGNVVAQRTKLKQEQVGLKLGLAF
ncbi:hypothetical protein [Stutzerimonas kirkiae]|uniref:Outer membrane protein beta-barrel domain-containing protein n=1 Tax=Stutzerimonas kirkiae TaxID=2211392 RepID=A0A4Q9R9N4_9GAMM|nr:hypothetical protein [Stutzerimonas kirkiae]TBU97245.1 hypothetical protein DNJ96_09205 [Stutzerimonas kirkiae]TBV03668.1 hypothetical protein DNJ95_06855 [Stutzerimonas kirkiae]TBV11338.1 hypothetical protein DNK08_03545 [Stutzerimonas kirkiae]TBV12456.1 hypothetical protein DNK01_14640 [Stutzerimonas kirkiae]